jgi:hypothetical protein
MNRLTALRLAFLAAPLLLGACETLKSIDFNPKPAPPPPCPRAVVGDNAGRLTRFNGAGEEPGNIVFEAEVADLAGSCVYNDNSIEVDLQIQLIAGRGPAGTEDMAAFNYFVAVARTDKTILSRDGFDTSIDLPADKTRGQSIEELEQTIPLAQGETGDNLVIVVGIEMTPDELEFNRKQGR